MKTGWDVAVVVVVALCCFGFALLAAMEERSRRVRAARSILRLAHELTGAATTMTPLYVHDETSGLIVTGKEVLAVDLRGEGALLQAYELSHIAALKVYEDKRDDMSFRLVTKNQSETRSVRLRGAVAITRIFEYLSRAGVELQYVPEES